MKLSLIETISLRIVRPTALELYVRRLLREPPVYAPRFIAVPPYEVQRDSTPPEGIALLTGAVAA